jgi:hypothetical protein
MDVSLHMDGGGYARADGRETPCEEHFDPLGGRNTQQWPVCPVPATAQNQAFLTLHSLGILLVIVSDSPRCLVSNVNEGLDSVIKHVSGKG